MQIQGLPWKWRWSLKVLEYDLLVLEIFDWLEVYWTFCHVTVNSGNFDGSCCTLQHVEQQVDLLDESVVSHAAEYSNLTSQRQGLMYCCLTPWLATILWSSVKVLLLLSRGQATADRGFSVNAQLEVDNLLKMPLLPNILFMTMWVLSVGCRTLIAATTNCWWHLPQLDRSTWLTLMMKRRRNPVAEERSQKLWVMKLMS